VHQTPEDIFGLYRDEITRSNAIIHQTAIGGKPNQRDPWWGEWTGRFTSLRIVLLHVIGETATHAGHLDAAAELLDGRQWIVQ